MLCPFFVIIQTLGCKKYPPANGACFYALRIKKKERFESLEFLFLQNYL